MRRPPRKWWDRMLKKVKAGGGADDPEAVVGDIWFNKLTPAERRTAVSKESFDLDDELLAQAIAEVEADRQRQVQGAEPLEAEVTCLGDLRCPDCRSILVTPLKENGHLAWVRPGDLACPSCQHPLTVTSEAARKANRRLEAYGTKDVEKALARLMEED